MPAVAYIREVKPSPRHPQPRWRVYHETSDGEVKVGINQTLRQAEQVRDRVNRYGLDAVLGVAPGEAGYRLNKRVLPRFGDIPLGELDADTIGLWKGDMLGEGLAPRTINTHISLLGTILNAAVDSGSLDRSPLLRHSGPGRVAIVRNVPVEKREVWLTREQLDRLTAAIPAATTPWSPSPRSPACAGVS
jgi:hypothetical protein